jgi:hypothetical protein
MKFARDLIPRIDAVRTRRRRSFPDITEEIFWSYYETCKHTSLLHVTGFYNLFQSMIYIRDNAISGCAVECGCFLGGAAAFLGLMRNHRHMNEMEIVLFDTFEGPPGRIDGQVLRAENRNAAQIAQLRTTNKDEYHAGARVYRRFSVHRRSRRGHAPGIRAEKNCTPKTGHRLLFVNEGGTRATAPTPL